MEEGVSTYLRLGIEKHFLPTGWALYEVGNY